MDDETALLIEQRIAPPGSRASERYVVCFFAGGGPLDGQFVLLKSDPNWHTPSVVRIGERDGMYAYTQLTDTHYYYRGFRDAARHAD